MEDLGHFRAISGLDTRTWVEFLAIARKNKMLLLIYTSFGHIHKTLKQSVAECGCKLLQQR